MNHKVSLQKALALAVIAVGVSAAGGAMPASAAEIYGYERYVYYTAAAGERNQLTVGGEGVQVQDPPPDGPAACLQEPSWWEPTCIEPRFSAGVVGLSDRGASIRTAPSSRLVHPWSCAATGGEAACAVNALRITDDHYRPPWLSLWIDLGDLDDTLALGVPARVVAGAGQDTVTGSPYSDSFVSRDGEIDTVDCGASYDGVTADKDDVLSGCEYVDYPATETSPETETSPPSRRAKPKRTIY